jgi:hypothetical protein
MPNDPAGSKTTPAEHAAALARVLHKAGEQFQFYAAEHRKKGTPDGDAKAKTNADWARRCFDACAVWEHANAE